MATGIATLLYMARFPATEIRNNPDEIRAFRTERGKVRKSSFSRLFLPERPETVRVKSGTSNGFLAGRGFGPKSNGGRAGTCVGKELPGSEEGFPLMAKGECLWQILFQRLPYAP